MADFIEIGNKMINTDRITFIHVTDEVIIGVSKKEKKVVINFDQDNSIDFSGQEAEDFFTSLKRRINI